VLRASVAFTDIAWLNGFAPVFVEAVGAAVWETLVASDTDDGELDTGVAVRLVDHGNEDVGPKMED
jgi:hypothetical protein